MITQKEADKILNLNRQIILDLIEDENLIRRGCTHEEYMKHQTKLGRTRWKFKTLVQSLVEKKEEQ